MMSAAKVLSVMRIQFEVSCFCYAGRRRGRVQGLGGTSDNGYQKVMASEFLALRIEVINKGFEVHRQHVITCWVRLSTRQAAGNGLDPKSPGQKASEETKIPVPCSGQQKPLEKKPLGLSQYYPNITLI